MLDAYTEYSFTNHIIAFSKTKNTYSNNAHLSLYRVQRYHNIQEQFINFQKHEVKHEVKFLNGKFTLKSHRR